ncbi:MAG: aminopeptidase P family N-terminal domain-containing protein, partial [Rickettsiales bacterium]
MDNLAEQETGTDQERRLAALRTELEKEGVDGFLITTADEYQGEYPPASARRLAWLSGFTGSAGALAVLPDEAAIFVDGRYTVQARQQVDAGDYQQCGLSPGYASVAEWLKDNAKPGSKIAYDPWLHTQNFIETMDRALKGKGVDLVAIANNPIDALWHDRPAIPQAPVQVHPAERAGEESASKRKRVGKSVADKGCDAVMITAPDSIAWLLNIRGGDVSHTPLALSYAMLHADGKVDWFIDEAKLSDNVRKHVGADVRIHSPEEMEQALVALGRDKKTVLYDAVRSAAWFHQQLEEAGATIKRGDDPCLLPKACKNPVEIEGMRQAHIRDGVALAKLLCWLDQEAPKGHVMELDVEDKLLAFRQEQADFQEPSFATIAGSGEHGAIVHYKASEKSNKSLENNSLFLLDSGGQYLDGTTDVTRTIVVGT